MPQKFRLGNINVGLSTNLQATDAAPDAQTPFRILIMGDFSGRANRGIAEPGQLGRRRPVLVDRDNFEKVLAKAGVQLRLALAGENESTIDLQFSELDEFHPDRIFQRVGLFEALRDLRRRLNNPATSNSAAAEVRRWAKVEEPPARPAAVAAPLAESPAEMLDQLLGATPAELPPRGAAPGGANWNEFLARAVQPYLAPREDPQLPDLLAMVDEATSGQMRALLHHPAFQEVEAAWRGLYYLVRHLDTDEGLKLYVLDVSKAELATDLTTRDDLSDSGTCKLLVEPTVGTPGAQPWAVVLGLYAFDQRPQDVALLARLAKLCQVANAPFLAEARPSLLGCASLAATPDPRQWQMPPDLDAWQALRQLPQAAWLGLVLPRVLLRPPYGKDTSPTEQFDFEEVAETPAHEAFLWGNPALFAAYLIGETFNRHGWDMRPGMIQDIEGLPIYVRMDTEETQPCAEVVLIDRAVAAIFNQGLMAVRSVQNRDMVAVPQFHSVAEPAQPLAGRWQ
jgi:type VI secretion system protein ImpC